MDLGRSDSLRSTASVLRRDAQDTDHLQRRVTHGLAGLHGTTDKYQARTVEALHGRWGEVGSVLRGLSTDSEDVAQALDRLADVLDAARHAWSATAGEAHHAGFAVQEDRWAPTVTAPAGADDAAVAHAHDLQQRLRAIADDVEHARGQLRGTLGGVAVHRLSVLHAGRSRGVDAATGDGDLDAEVDRVVGPLLAAHDVLPRKV